jgi:hypothetical protein
MTENGNGVISPNDLMKKLANAKKVMNKVEKGDFVTGQVNENILLSNPEDIDMSSLYQYDHLNKTMTEGEITNYGDVSRFNVNKPLDVEKVNKSKLPDVIKKAMIEHPIAQPEISLTDGIDIKIIKGARRLMEQDTPKNKQIQEQKHTQHTQHQSSSDIVNTLIPIMENMIRKVMDEKLNQILTAQQTQSINENLVLKVGDSVFKGKITGVNKSR